MGGTEENVPAFVKTILAHQERKQERNRCELCGKGFMCASALDIHMRSHSGARPFTCRFCGMTFGVKSNLYRHERTKHSDI